MDRTIAPGNVDRRYIDEDHNVGIQGTAIIAADRNAVQEELIHLIEGGGLAPSAGDETQVLHAVREIARVMPPIGTIWMYDGTDWVDNVTLPGWYACIPENEDGGVNGLAFGIRSMVDRFAVGGAIVAAGTIGGANSYQLSVGQLPAHNHTINHAHGEHSHTINHGHTASSGLQSSNHSHAYSTGPWAGAGGAFQSTSSGAWGARSSGGVSANHSHAITVANHSGSSGTATINYSGNSGATGLGETIDKRPAFYSMVFIRRCA